MEGTLAAAPGLLPGGGPQAHSLGRTGREGSQERWLLSLPCGRGRRRGGRRCSPLFRNRGCNVGGPRQGRRCSAKRRWSSCLPKTSDRCWAVTIMVPQPPWPLLWEAAPPAAWIWTGPQPGRVSGAAGHDEWQPTLLGDSDGLCCGREEEGGAIQLLPSKIQRSGHIQPFGATLAVDEPSFHLLAFSENAPGLLDLPQSVPSLYHSSPQCRLALGSDVRSLFTPSSALLLDRAASAREITRSMSPTSASSSVLLGYSLQGFLLAHGLTWP